VNWCSNRVSERTSTPNPLKGTWGSGHHQIVQISNRFKVPFRESKISEANRRSTKLIRGSNSGHHGIAQTRSRFKVPFRGLGVKVIVAVVVVIIE